MAKGASLRGRLDRAADLARVGDADDGALRRQVANAIPRHVERVDRLSRDAGVLREREGGGLAREERVTATNQVQVGGPGLDQ